jgi:hypothetical protein
MCDGRAIDTNRVKAVNSRPVLPFEARIMGVTNSGTADSPIAILVDDDAEVRDSLGELLNSVGIDSISFLPPNKC